MQGLPSEQPHTWFVSKCMCFLCVGIYACAIRVAHVFCMLCAAVAPMCATMAKLASINFKYMVRNPVVVWVCVHMPTACAAFVICPAAGSSASTNAYGGSASIGDAGLKLSSSPQGSIAMRRADSSGSRGVCVCACVQAHVCSHMCLCRCSVCNAHATPSQCPALRLITLQHAQIDHPATH